MQTMENFIRIVLHVDELVNETELYLYICYRLFCLMVVLCPI